MPFAPAAPSVWDCPSPTHLISLQVSGAQRTSPNSPTPRASSASLLPQPGTFLQAALAEWCTPCLRGGLWEEGRVIGWDHNAYCSLLSRYDVRPWLSTVSLLSPRITTLLPTAAIVLPWEMRTDTLKDTGFMRLPRLCGWVVAEKEFETWAVWLDIVTPTWILATLLKVSENEVSL